VRPLTDRRLLAAVLAAALAPGIGGVAYATTPDRGALPGSGDERHVTNIVHKSFADQLGLQAELVGDSVQVDSFQCSYAYTWRGATYFTCEAGVGVKAVDASADAEYVYWLLVVDRHNTVSWRIQVPDKCDSQGLMEC
jgi:hypothetical protein